MHQRTTSRHTLLLEAHLVELQTMSLAEVGGTLLGIVETDYALCQHLLSISAKGIERRLRVLHQLPVRDWAQAVHHFHQRVHRLGVVRATRDPAEVREDTDIRKHKYLPDLADGVRTKVVKVMRPLEPLDRTPMVFSWTADGPLRTQDICRILVPPPNFGR